MLMSLEKGLCVPSQSGRTRDGEERINRRKMLESGEGQGCVCVCVCVRTMIESRGGKSVCVCVFLRMMLERGEGQGRVCVWSQSLFLCCSNPSTGYRGEWENLASTGISMGVI